MKMILPLLITALIASTSHADVFLGGNSADLKHDPTQKRTTTNFDRLSVGQPVRAVILTGTDAEELSDFLLQFPSFQPDVRYSGVNKICLPHSYIVGDDSGTNSGHPGSGGSNFRCVVKQINARIIAASYSASGHNILGALEETEKDSALFCYRDVKGEKSVCRLGIGEPQSATGSYSYASSLQDARRIFSANLQLGQTLGSTTFETSSKKLSLSCEESSQGKFFECSFQVR